MVIEKKLPPPTDYRQVSKGLAIGGKIRKIKNGTFGDLANHFVSRQA